MHKVLQKPAYLCPQELSNLNIQKHSMVIFLENSNMFSTYKWLP